VLEAQRWVTYVPSGAAWRAGPNEIKIVAFKQTQKRESAGLRRPQSAGAARGGSSHPGAAQEPKRPSQSTSTTYTSRAPPVRGVRGWFSANGFTRQTGEQEGAQSTKGRGRLGTLLPSKNGSRQSGINPPQRRSNSHRGKGGKDKKPPRRQLSSRGGRRRALGAGPRARAAQRSSAAKVDGEGLVSVWRERSSAAAAARGAPRVGGLLGRGGTQKTPARIMAVPAAAATAVSAATTAC
jgi:hypothetical protein